MSENNNEINENSENLEELVEAEGLGETSEEDVVADFAVESEDDESLDQALVEAAEASSTTEVEEVTEEVKEEIEGSELASFESAEIEEEEFIPTEQMESILESMLFATDKPLSLAAMKAAFKGTNVKTRQIKKALDQLAVEYASVHRGVTLEQVAGGYQLKTKVDNMDFLKRMVKARPFKLSGPAMEVLAIVAYKQPLIKADIDEIRGVESGHLLRALMEKGIVSFAGKSDLPGKPMLYETSRKFLDIFSLKSLKELPTLSEIDELLPDGIGEDEAEKETLSDLTDSLSEQAGESYSEGEAELLKITDQLSTIETSSDFFEQEKQRQKEKRERERARDIQDALDVGEDVDPKDARWLERYNAKLAEQAEAEAKAAEEAQNIAENEGDSSVEPAIELAEDTELTAVTDDETALEMAESDDSDTDAATDVIELSSENETVEVSDDNELDLILADDTEDTVEEEGGEIPAVESMEMSEEETVNLEEEVQEVEDIRLHVDPNDPLEVAEAVEALKAFEEDDADSIIAIDEKSAEQ